MHSENRAHVSALRLFCHERLWCTSTSFLTHLCVHWFERNCFHAATRLIVCSPRYATKAVWLREHRHNFQQGLLEITKLAQHAYEEGHIVGWDDARVLEIESNGRYRKYGMLNQSNQPIQCGSPSSAMGFPTHREDLYDVTDSALVSIRFQSLVFRFYSTDGASGRYYSLHNVFLPISLHWCSCTWFSWLGL
jgi:hypothetical protein